MGIQQKIINTVFQQQSMIEKGNKSKNQGKILKILKITNIHFERHECNEQMLYLKQSFKQKITI